MEKTILKAEGLKKGRGKGFSLDIQHIEFTQGKIWGLTGPNGSGKSTLLKILNLLESPDEGTVFYDGNPVTPSSLVETRQKMGMVMENPYLFHTSVFKNVAAGLKFHSIDRGAWESMVREALAMVGLEGFEERCAPELSRGESQRVAIARVLAFRPEIIFLDEPFSNIDRKHAAILEGLIRTITVESETTIIFTTHDLLQASRLGDEVISILDGKISEGLEIW